MNFMSPRTRRQRKEAACMKRQLQKVLATGGMPAFLDRFVGRGNWRHDDRENLWIVPDRKYRGPGHQYYCIDIKGDWFMARLPDEVVQ